MLYVRGIAEKLLSTLLLVFISSCCFIYNARRDTAVEKEFDILIQTAVEHVLVQRFKKKEMGEQKLLTKLLKCYEASKFLYKNNLAKNLF